MDDFLRLAYERRERLRRELLAVEHLIAEHERSDSSTHRVNPMNYELPLGSARKSRRRPSPAADIASMLDAAERLILEEGTPLSRSELLARLEKEGFSFPGTDKVKVFGTNLWRSRRFISLKGHGYWPEGHSLPPTYAAVEQRPSMLK